MYRRSDSGPSAAARRTSVSPDGKLAGSTDPVAFAGLSALLASATIAAPCVRSVSVAGCAVHTIDHVNMIIAPSIKTFDIVRRFVPIAVSFCPCDGKAQRPL